LSFFRSSECTVRVKFAMRHFSDARNLLTPGYPCGGIPRRTCKYSNWR
jgi:hypothetical protein